MRFETKKWQRVDRNSQQSASSRIKAVCDKSAERGCGGRTREDEAAGLTSPRGANMIHKGSFSLSRHRIDADHLITCSIPHVVFVILEAGIRASNAGE